jgi:hypothetical protein
MVLPILYGDPGEGLLQIQKYGRLSLPGSQGRKIPGSRQTSPCFEARMKQTRNLLKQLWRAMELKFGVVWKSIFFMGTKTRDL